MKRRVFSREFKLEAVKLIKDRGAAVAQAARDLDVAESVLRRWVREGGVDPQHSFPGHGQVKPEFDYNERFYNPQRRRSTIGYVSPMEFERVAAAS